MVLAFLLAGLFGRSLQRQPLRERLRRDGFRPPPRDGFRREPRNGRRRITFDGFEFIGPGRNGTIVNGVLPPPPPPRPPFTPTEGLPTAGETLDAPVPPDTPPPPPPPRNGGPEII